jgi:hypothetical protein
VIRGTVALRLPVAGAPWIDERSRTRLQSEAQRALPPRTTRAPIDWRQLKDAQPQVYSLPSSRTMLARAVAGCQAHREIRC